MLAIILGKLGSGKTLIMTLLALADIRDIWSNYQIKDSRYNELDIPDLFDLPDKIILLMDEAYSWIESRVSSTSLNEYLSSILYHSRKAFTDIYLTTPEFSAIDKRFRKLANYIVFCGYRSNFESDDFHFIFYDKDNNSYGSMTLLYQDAIQFFKLYNTYEKVDSFRKKGLQFKIMKKYPERLRDYVVKLTELVSNEINGKITHDIVKDKLLMNGIDLAYEPLIYIRLKGKQNDNNN